MNVLFDSSQDAALVSTYLDEQRDDFYRFLKTETDWDPDERSVMTSTIIDGLCMQVALQEDDTQAGIELLHSERLRQLEAEGFGPEHDDGHERGELIDAALSYIRSAINGDHPAMATPPREWPWEEGWWKPSGDPVRDLTKAGALIAAEIDRLRRQEAQTSAEATS